MAYHFEYLALLLSGAIDAQTRIVKHVYGVSGQPKYASYKNANFMKRLRSQGAGTICDLVEGGVYHDFLVALRKIRNTIHADALGDVGYSSPATGDVGLLTLGGEDAQVVLQCVRRLGDPHVMGFLLFIIPGYRLNPFDARRSSSGRRCALSRRSRRRPTLACRRQAKTSIRRLRSYFKRGRSIT
jgi:hypothetical protein